MSRTVFAIILVCVLVGSLNASWAAESQRVVLAIYSSRSNLAGNTIVNDTIRTVLGAHTNIDYRNEYINNATTLSESTLSALSNFLRSKYASESVDVIMAIGTDAVRFANERGAELFPGVPIVTRGSRDLVERWGDGPPVVAVLEPELVKHMQGQLNFILSVQPNVREVVVVSGAGEIDRQRELVTRQALQPFENRIKLTYLSGLSLEDTQRRLSKLPARTAILFLTVSEDGAGKRLQTRDVLVKIAPTANAPIYAYTAAHLGSGVVGGFVLDQELMAREAAEVALRILQGEKITDIPSRETSATPKVDWRALRRWSINENRLPAGTSIQFREPSLWDIYKWRIIGVLSLCVVEAVLILALLIQRAQRRRAEEEATRSRQLLQSSIDALDTHVVLLDEHANIIAVNESWRRFTESLGNAHINYGVGNNYLHILESYSECDAAVVIGKNVRDVMRGESTGFSHSYQRSSGRSESWFELKVYSFLSQGVLRMALTHQDITELKRAHEIQEQHNGQLLQAQDEERRRIARDLHEVTAQNIAMVKAELSIAWAASTGRRTAEQLREGILVCDQVIKELRTLSYLLHPPFLDDAGLVPALRWYVRGFVERTTIDVEILLTEDIGRLSLDTETALFRVVQESLTNIHRHSGSRSAVVWLTKDKEEVVVRIQDDGCGINEKADNAAGGTPGVGIMGMRHRLRQLGGRLEIESDSHGTTVTARTPISKEAYIAHSGS